VRNCELKQWQYPIFRAQRVLKFSKHVVVVKAYNRVGTGSAMDYAGIYTVDVFSI
jgi:hypothetical protein